MVGHGLENTVYTCYMNSVLQALLHTPSILNILHDNVHQKCVSDDFCAPHTFLNLAKMEPGEGNWVRPTEFLRHRKDIGPEFKSRMQHDAHEFLVCLLDKLNSGCTAT